jgi:hypothetical protein
LNNTDGPQPSERRSPFPENAVKSPFRR